MKRSMFAIPLVVGLGFSFVVAGPAEQPQQKPGLWETRIQHASNNKGANKPGVAQNCLDASTIAHSRETADEYAKKNCSKNDTRKEGAKWITDIVCKAGNSTMSSHAVTEFKGDDAYHTENSVTFDPPESGLTSTTTTIDGKWLGACKTSG